MLSIFISSPANEFKEERIKIKKFIEENSILNQIFEVFVFEEDVVATGKQSDEIYLEKARNRECPKTLKFFSFFILIQTFIKFIYFI